ncbi:hypothetical protein JCM8547_008276 [Rhodosporidiobolus lusitaniae]
MAQVLSWSDRVAHDSLLDLFSPHHFSERKRAASPPPQRSPVTRTRRNSVASSLASVHTALTHLFIPSPRPASVLSRPALPPLLALPSELLLYILDLALSPTIPVIRRSDPDRNRTLLALSLIHPILRHFAQQELFGNVVLDSDKAIERLLKLAVHGGQRGKALTGQITSVKVYGSLSSGDGGKMLAALVQELKGLEKLHLENLDGLELRQFVVHPTLKTLTATRCGFRSRFRLSGASRPCPLTSLSIINCTAHDDALSGFTLPHLTHLVIHDVSLPPPSALAVLEPSDAMKRLGKEVAHQLTHLETDEAHFSFFFPLEPVTLPSGRVKSPPCRLTHLTLLKLSHFSPLLHDLPPASLLPLTHLTLSPPSSFLPGQTSPDRASSHFSSLLSPFRSSAPALPPSLSHLRHLELDGRYRYWSALPGEEGEEMRELLVRLDKAGVEWKWGEERDGGESRRRRQRTALVDFLQDPARAMGGNVRAGTRATPRDLLLPVSQPSSFSPPSSGENDSLFRTARSPVFEGEEGEATPRASAGGVEGREKRWVSYEGLLQRSEGEGVEKSLKKAGREGGKEPPSPLGLPGGWTGGGVRVWRSARSGCAEEEAEEEEEDEGLVLPPPFLADDSARESFDGLLGARSRRRTQRLLAQHERLHSLGRAPPLPFPQSLIKAGMKLVKLLGPPGGFDTPSSSSSLQKKGKEKKRVIEAAFSDEEDADGQERREKKDDETRRRRVKRAESGVRAYELGAEVGRKVAGRLERHRSWRGADEDGVRLFARRAEKRVQEPEGQKKEEEPAKARRMRAATPSQLLGSPPSALTPADTPLDAPPSPSLTPIDSSLPTLTPLFIPSDGRNPLPPLHTPFSLDPTEPIDDDYFGLKRRRSRRSSLTPSLPSSSSPFLSPLPCSTHLPPRAYSTLLDTLIYLLIGSPSPPSSLSEPQALDTSLSSLGGLLGLLVHLVGFAFFLVYHTLTLFAASYDAGRKAAVWVHWAGRNLTGRTEVSRSVREYWGKCRGEWERVCEEEGEGRLGVWAVLRGLVELTALQSITHSRFLSDGPGCFDLLTTFPSLDPSTPRTGPSPFLRRRTSLHAPHNLDRPSFTQQESSYRWTSGGDEQEGEGLVVEKQGGGVLEGSIISHDTQSSDPAYRGEPKSFKTPRAISKVVEEEDEGEEPPFLDLGGASHPPPPPAPSAVMAFLFPIAPDSPPLLPLPEQPSSSYSTLLSDLKRHTRLATASYGLHTYLVDAPTPLMTPSGKTLPHRLFAHLGGMKDYRNVLHVALQKRFDEEDTPSSGRKKEGEGEQGVTPYSPQFYILRDDARGEVVVVIRGTQSLADVRADLDGDFVDFPLPAPHPPSPSASSSSSSSSPPKYRIHSGILSAARHLLSPSSSPPSPLLNKLRTILADHPRYSLTFTGHSLGAALASTLALLLGEYDEDRKGWYVDPASVLGNSAVGEGEKKDEGFRRPLRSICLAHPTTVNTPLAARAALPSLSYPCFSSSSSPEGNGDGAPLVLSVSLSSDIITRAGLPQVRSLRRAIGRLDRLRKRRRKEEEEAGMEGGKGVLGSWWQWRKVLGKEGDEAEKQREELEEKAWRWREEVEGWNEEEEKEGEEETAIPAGKAYHVDRLPPALEARRRAELKAEREAAGEEEGEGEGEEEEELFGLYEVRDPRRFYRMPILDGGAVSSHMPKAYLDAIDLLS